MKISPNPERRIHRYKARLNALFRTTLRDSDRDSAWRSVRALRQTGSHLVLAQAVRWTYSNSPTYRTRGADILAQLGKTRWHPGHRFPEEAFSALSKLIENETNLDVIYSTLTAFHFIEDSRAVPLLLPFVLHADSDIRFACAFSLGYFAKQDDALNGLLKLMKDTNSHVRDWATFGVAQYGSDSEGVRLALLDQLEDNDEDTWEEAACGLAQRSDLRVIEPLIQALERAERRNRDHPRLNEAANCLLVGDEFPRLELTKQELVDCLRGISKKN